MATPSVSDTFLAALSGMSNGAQGPSIQAAPVAMPQGFSYVVENEGFVQRNWPKLLILGLLVLAIMVGISIFRMNKKTSTIPSANDDFDDRLFVPASGPPHSSVKKVRFQEPVEDNEYGDYTGDAYSFGEDYASDDPYSHPRAASTVQLTPEEAADPLFEPL